ncbi:zinc finger domain-containing protein [Nonomuraea rubra]
MTTTPEERITLDDLAVQLDAVAVWLRQLALAAERPAVPVELGENVCQRLDALAKELAELGRDVAKVDIIISEQQPLRPHLHANEPWGARAHGSDRTEWGKRLSTVLSLRQILWLAADANMPWRDEEPGIPYLAGLAGLPGLEDWESPRAAARRTAERLAAIDKQALQEECDSCSAGAGKHCRTKNGRYAEAFHRPRIRAAAATVDEQLADARDGDR